MKKLWIFVIAMCVTFSMAAVAQDMGKSCDMGKDKAAAAPLKTLKGTVKADGDKITFSGPFIDTSDFDKRLQMLENASAEHSANAVGWNGL